MPNGGTHNCESCNYFRDDFCRLRSEVIDFPFWTTCMNRNRPGRMIDGVICAIVCEVKNRGGSYCEIPYYNGIRADTVQEGSGDTRVVWRGNAGEELVFDDVRAYLEFYRRESEKKKKFIIGAVAGDIIGSVYEHRNVRKKDFLLFSPKTRFTDDSVMTFATMYAILNNADFAKIYQAFGRKYPGRGYGGRFRLWISEENPAPYNSWGNGSAMRVSPVGWAFSSLNEVLENAERSAVVSHNHPEGIKGAQATAAAVFLARTGKSKNEIQNYIKSQFQYDLNRTVSEIRDGYEFDISCQGTVPEAIIAFLESSGFEDAVRNAVSLGGDSDTLACITGAIAQAFYKEIPEYIVDNSLRVLPKELINLLEEFSRFY